MQLTGVLDQDHAVAARGDFGKERIDQRRLAGRSAAGDEDVLPFPDRRAQELGLQVGHDAGRDIIVEGEDGDGLAANGEARRRDHRRNQALETAPRFPAVRRRRAGDASMNLDPDMMGDEPHDALGVGGRDAEAGVLEAARQPVDPEPAVGIEHHLDDAGIFEIAGNRWPQRGAQHPRAAGESFGSEGDRRHGHAPLRRLGPEADVSGVD